MIITFTLTSELLLENRGNVACNDSLYDSVTQVDGIIIPLACISW